MTHRLGVSIINYRTADLTLACLRSVLSDFDGIDGYVAIVDNASGDGSDKVIADWIAAQPGDLPVTLVHSKTNSGFSGGHNQGMAALDAEYYLLLNSDAILTPGFCATILAVADRNSNSGFVAPRIAHDDGEPQTSAFRFASPLSEFIRGANTGWITTALKRWEVALGPDPDPAAIEWASFACILVRGTMVDQIGSMDEGYFLYFEDAEYCLRARRAGWRIMWAPAAVAIHFRGGSGPVKSLAKARKRMPAYYYASRTRFLYQARGLHGLLAANTAWFIGRGLTQVRRLFGKPIRPAVEAEGRDIWINAHDPLGPRRAPWETVGE